MFDEQFLHGNDIFGHCQKYRGAQIEASHLLNLSRYFARMMKENHQAAKRLQEKPLEGCTVFAKDQEGSPSAGDELTEESSICRRSLATLTLMVALSLAKEQTRISSKSRKRRRRSRWSSRRISSQLLNRRRRSKRRSPRTRRRSPRRLRRRRSSFTRPKLQHNNQTLWKQTRKLQKACSVPLFLASKCLIQISWQIQSSRKSLRHQRMSDRDSSQN